MIQLRQVWPSNLKDKPTSEASAIWGKHLQIQPPGYYKITAPSGQGKTTLLHLIYGLRRDYTGHINLQGKDIQHLSADSWASLRQNKLSAVFQDLRLFPTLTALENIQLKAQLTQYTHTQTIHQMAQQLGIAELLSQSCQTLSYGQQQRVAIIRALCQPFQMLLLDEPFSHLDTANAQAAQALIHQTCQTQQAGIILTSLGQNKATFPNAKTLHL